MSWRRWREWSACLGCSRCRSRRPCWPTGRVRLRQVVRARQRSHGLCVGLLTERRCCTSCHVSKQQHSKAPASRRLHAPLAARPPPAAGGVLCVCFWPQIVEERGPWQLLTALTSSFRPQTDWEQAIPGDALGEGAQLLQVGDRWSCLVLHVLRHSKLPGVECIS